MKLNGNVLRNARDRKVLTQVQVAEALGMSVATVNKAENGGDVHAVTGKRLCEFLEVDLISTIVPRPENEEAVEQEA